MAVNVVQSALSSRRFNRWLLVLGALVLAAGIAAILVTKVGNNSGTTHNTAPATAAPSNAAPKGPNIAAAEKAQKNIRFPVAGWKVAKQFILTAAARKNLAQAYALADENVRGGLTRKQWMSGNIPVPYFPASKIVRYNWKNTNFARPRDAAVNLLLFPTAKSGQRAGPFLIEVVKVGKGAKAHWLVDYFGAVQGVPLPHP
jgi:uncharacterized protein YcnI